MPSNTRPTSSTKRSVGKTQKKLKAKPAPSVTLPANDTWDSAKLQAFVDGDMTLGELQGMSKETQYRLADMGYKLFGQGRYDKAQQIFAGLVALDPKDAYFLLACGSVAQRLDQLEAAERWYSQALRLDTQNTVAFANRGEVRMEMGKLQKGAADLVAALKYDPKFEQPTSKRARALLVGLKASLEEQAKLKSQAKPKKPSGTTAPASKKRT